MLQRGESPDGGEGRSETCGEGASTQRILDTSTLVSAHPMTWGSLEESDSSSPTAPFVVELNDSDIREIESHAFPRFKSQHYSSLWFS
jgi:hypothetical protein